MAVPLEQRSFEPNSEKLFLRRGGKSGSAAHRYCDQLLTLLKGHWDVVQTHIRNMSAHGLRKGSATHVASATTCPPPIASIANRGDWSLGKVLDVYWQFAESGDAYLGRCLSGLDPNTSAFSVLPPHWTVVPPLEDDDIAAGLECMYGPIVRCHPSSIGLLVRVLASVTYSSDWLREVTVANRRHPFSTIPLLQNPELLQRLKEKVTIEATVTMGKATGIPPHVSQLNLMCSLLELCQSTLVKVNEQTEIIRLSIFEALENRALENGQVTRASIQDILEQFRANISEDVGRQIEMLREEGFGGNNRNARRMNNEVEPARHDGNQGTLFAY